MRAAGASRVHDWRRNAGLGEDRDRGLARPELREQLLEVVEVGLRKGPHRRPQRFLVVRRERAESVLDAVAELAEDVCGNVLRRLGHEEDADAFRADQPHGLRRGLDECLARAVEQKMGLVEEEDEPRLVAIADFGKLLEELRHEPHEDGRPESRLVLHRRELEAGDDPSPVRGSADEVGDVELRLAEEVVSAALFERR